MEPRNARGRQAFGLAAPIRWYSATSEERRDEVRQVVGVHEGIGVEVGLGADTGELHVEEEAGDEVREVIGD
jgi:hypothetical protein